LARQKLNLDLKSMDQLMYLVHGQYGHGKTDFVGDMLATEKASGPVVFVNVKGEDGTMTLANKGLGDTGETLETYADFIDFTNELMKKPVQALAVDSLKPLVQLAVYGTVCGEGKLPSGSDHWQQIHFKTEELLKRLRRCAKYVGCVCPSDKSVNQLDGKTYITPDLPGRQAVGSAGWFDLVVFIKAETNGPNKVKRTLVMAPSVTTVTRQRLPKVITEDLVLPDGPGGWAVLKKRIEQALA
jgi:hypothetical protein